jgi:Cdc6-like AAA superfamily ATPase
MSVITDQQPTATDLLIKELKDFLTAEKAEVLCIRGEWGVGKTYTWNKILKATSDEKATAPNIEKYAYVSLFGLTTLDQLKYAIFENTIKVAEIGKEPSLDTLKENVMGVGTHLGKRLMTTVLELIPYTKNAVQSLQALSFLSVRNQIICFDDLERRGKDLRLLDVLGLTSFLSEHRKCKVVLILNDEELTDDDKGVLNKYEEKVVDISLLFRPTAQDCVKIALEDNKTSEGEQLAKFCVALGVSNIRVIKKIERLVDAVSPLLKKFHARVSGQAIQTLTLLGWAYYSKAEKADDGTTLLEFVVKKHGKALYGTTAHKDLSEKEKLWYSMLGTYNFSPVDDFDLVLLDGIKSGFFDEKKLIDKATTLNKRFSNEAALTAYDEAWGKYRGTFEDNTDEALDGIAKAFKKVIPFCNARDLDGCMQTLKAFGKADIADQLLNEFMAIRNEDRKFYDIHNQPFGDELGDEALKTAFAERVEKWIDRRLPQEILLSVYQSRNWSQEDLFSLASLSVDDFYNIFKSVRGADLHHMINGALYFRSVRGPSQEAEDEYAKIVSRTEEALRRINRRRVVAYGITIPDEIAPENK